jgi:hypothetical protein
MSEVFLIHEPDVYFDVIEPEMMDRISVENTDEQLHHGEIYISLCQIFLHDNKRWYKANIQDIKDIKTDLSHKQLIIHFCEFDMVLSCRDHAHLMALRDFLYLSQNIPSSYEILPHASSIMCTENSYQKLYRKKIEKYQKKNN